jgi:hypothetical protein
MNEETCRALQALRPHRRERASLAQERVFAARDVGTARNKRADITPECRQPADPEETLVCAPR